MTKYYLTNFTTFVSDYKEQIEEIKPVLNATSALELFRSVKRDVLEKGPYPNVTFFEAANRILSDCVIINAVFIILKNENKEFPKVEYVTIDFGHSENQDHDIIGYNQLGKEVLCAEAFNVSESFFKPKLYKTNSRLRNSKLKEAVKVMVYNEDASKQYQPKSNDIFHLKVKTLI